jgi:hypothetical protein
VVLRGAKRTTLLFHKASVSNSPVADIVKLQRYDCFGADSRRSGSGERSAVSCHSGFASSGKVRVVSFRPLSRRSGCLRCAPKLDIVSAPSDGKAKIGSGHLTDAARRSSITKRAVPPNFDVADATSTGDPHASIDPAIGQSNIGELRKLS